MTKEYMPMGVGRVLEYGPPDVYLDPAWLTWNNGTVLNLVLAITKVRCELCCGTGAIFLGISVNGIEDWGTCQLCTKGKGYVPRAEPQWDMMPILADALEEAGCTEAAILDHCRSGGPHVRGCWVLELLTDGIK